MRKVAVSSVTGLQRYYEQPDERNLPKNGGCLDNLIGLAIPAFVDGHGRSGHTGALAGGRLRPSARLPLRKRPLRRSAGTSSTCVGSSSSITARRCAADCPISWGNTVAWAEPPRDSRTGGPLFTRTPRRVRVCVFRTPADNFAVGNFIRGFRLDESRTRRLLGALTGAGPRRGCAKQRTFAVIIESPGSVAQVEPGRVLARGAARSPRRHRGTEPWRGRFSAAARRSRARGSTRPPRCRPRPGPARARR